jgi:hypothetical protein
LRRTIGCQSDMIFASSSIPAGKGSDRLTGRGKPAGGALLVSVVTQRD